MDRKTINAWCLYDFGNSAFAVIFPMVFSVYYNATIVGENTLGDRYWGYVASASMLLVALSGPLLGGVADHAGIRKRMLALYTVAGLLAVAAFTGLGPGTVLAASLLAVLANFAFEGGVVFYNAYLPDLAPPDHQGRVSARGFAVGYVGSLVALLVALPLIKYTWIGFVWIAMAAQWAVAAAYALRHLPPDRPTGMGIFRAARAGVRQTCDTFRDVLGRPNLRRFLLAYFFFEDGVNTVIIFAPVYATQELGFSRAGLIALYMCLQVAAVLGSVLIGKPTDRKGPRWAVRTLLLWWVMVVVLAWAAPTRPAFWVVAMLAGLGIGGIQSSARAFMARLIPDGREAEFFGFYALCGKTGAIMGPLLFGTLADHFGSRRPAILAVAAFYVFGFLLLRRVQPVVDPAPQA